MSVKAPLNLSMDQLGYLCGVCSVETMLTSIGTTISHLLDCHLPWAAIPEFGPTVSSLIADPASPWMHDECRRQWDRLRDNGVILGTDPAERVLFLRAWGRGAVARHNLWAAQAGRPLAADPDEGDRIC